MTEKRYDVFTELLHTGIGIMDNDKELTGDEVKNLLNWQEKTIKNQNQEIIACHDTLTTILEYVDAILNGLDIQDLFIKDYFQIIKNRDLNRMNKIIMELNGSDD